MSTFGKNNSLVINISFLQVFVNFAKEQTDEDNLTEVVTNNHTVPQTNPTAAAPRINPPAVQPQPPVTPPPPQPSKTPSPSKTPPQQGKSPDSKEGKSKKAKASKAKSKGGKANKEQGTAMTKIPDSEKLGHSKRRGSVESNSSDGEAQGESSKSRGSKQGAGSSSKDPSALFIVSSNTQESTM